MNTVLAIFQLDQYRIDVNSSIELNEVSYLVIQILSIESRAEKVTITALLAKQ